MDFVFDTASLASLRRQTHEAPAVANEEVARQFEGLFVQMMLKSMRQATPENSLFDNNQTRMLQSVLDEQMSHELTRPGLGLARTLLAQLQRWSGNVASDAHAGFQPLPQPVRLFRSAPGSIDLQQAPIAKPAPEPPQHIIDFVARLAEPARAVAQASGLPLKLILGQAALESGWGRHEIRTADGRRSHNLFGIKATSSWKGDVATVLTTEFREGKAYKTVQPFRSYSSYEHALHDYAQLITGSSRYRHVQAANNADDAARRIQEAGYATDPNYANKLIKVMQQLPLQI